MSVEVELVRDQESSSEKNLSSEESDDNAATDSPSIAESLESGEDYNEDSASFCISDEQYDEDSDLDSANSRVSAEQELNRPLPGSPPILHSVLAKGPPQLDQNLAPSVQLYTKILG